MRRLLTLQTVQRLAADLARGDRRLRLSQVLSRTDVVIDAEGNLRRARAEGDAGQEPVDEEVGGSIIWDWLARGRGPQAEVGNDRAGVCEIEIVSHRKENLRHCAGSSDNVDAFGEEEGEERVK